MSSHLHHRPMQSSARSNTVSAPDFSITDSLDTIKHEYQTLHTELIKVRSERDELELKRACYPFSPPHHPHLPHLQWSLNSPNWVQYEGPYSISKLNMSVLIATTKMKSNVYALNWSQFVSQAQPPYHSAFLVVVRVSLVPLSLFQIPLLCPKPSQLVSFYDIAP